MPTGRDTTTVELDDELWELVEGEAARAGVSVAHYVREAVIARLVVGPTDPRVHEMRAHRAPLSGRHHARWEREGGSAAQLDTPGAGRSVFRISPDWRDIRAQESGHLSPDTAAPDPTWLHDERIHPDDLTHVRAGIARAAQSRDACELEYRVHLGQVVRMVNLRAMPLVGADGAITEWLAVATDVSDASA